MRIWMILVGPLAFATLAHGQAPAPTRPRPTWQPAGIILPPQLPVSAVGTARPNTPSLRAPNLRFPVGAFYGGYDFGWPTWSYDPAPVVINNFIQTPSGTLPPPKPVEIRARLALTLPANAKVWLAGREVDAAARPLILESPPLQDGQLYSFDVKFSWTEGGKTAERSRKMIVGAGEQASIFVRGG